MNFLHHKKTAPAKRFLSLLCVLALCLGLLPVTALADGTAPQTLYVGNQVITNGYWTSSDGGTAWSREDDEPSGGSYIYYDGNGTLTLKDATIKGGSTNDSFGAGIYAVSSANSDVALTINLEGTSTVSGDYGVCVQANQTSGSGGNSALLTISGDGTLIATGNSNHGIAVYGYNGGAALTIENATVNASTSGTWAAGVYVQSGSQASASPEISLTVKGGNLTASGGENSDGILFYVGSPNATATTSLTIGGNAIVDAKSGGISASDPNSDISNQIKVSSSGDGNNGGIVFDGTEGTVYGDVTLDKSLTINQGETLTIPKDASLNCNGNLTNNGTILVESGGSVSGNLSGGATPTMPTITGQPTSQTVTEGDTATFTVAASDAQTYQWQQKTSDSSDWEDISDYATSASYTTAATTTDMNNYQYRCMVKSASGVGVISSAATLTVNEKVEPTTYTISANVNPTGAGTVTVNDSTSPVSVVANSTVNLAADANPGYRFTDWTSSNGVTFGDASSASTTFTMPAGNVTVTANFEQVYNVTVNATAGGTVTGGGTYAEGDTVTLTATPDSGYHFAGWNVLSGTDTIQNNQFAMPAENVDIQAIFARNTSPSIPPTVSEETTDAIQDAKPGETVTVDLSSGSTKLDKEVFETLAGKDITLVVELSGGLSWTINGTDIPENAELSDLDLGVTMDSDGIPVDLINAITGEHGSVQMTLAHDGAFGFTMTLTAPLGAENAGYWANLYHFDESTNKMSFETAAPIGSDGSVSLALSHASQYAIVIDDHNRGIVTLPFTDVREGDWFYDPVCFVYSQGLLTGTSATTFEPNTHLSRAMLVAILHRLEGSPAASAGDFTDVADGDWYAQAVNWAASVGVVNGFDDGTFQPNAAITREQMAAILCNYAQYKGFDTSASGDLSTYSDAASVSDWAQESVEWMVGSGLLGGYEDSTLRPQGTTTRAEVASVLQRALGNVAGNQ